MDSHTVAAAAVVVEVADRRQALAWSNHQQAGTSIAAPWSVISSLQLDRVHHRDRIAAAVDHYCNHCDGGGLTLVALAGGAALAHPLHHHLDDRPRWRMVVTTPHCRSHNDHWHCDTDLDEHNSLHRIRPRKELLMVVEAGVEPLRLNHVDSVDIKSTSK